MDEYEEQERVNWLNHAIDIGHMSAISFRDAAELNRKAYEAARIYSERVSTPVVLYTYTLHAFLQGFRDNASNKPPKTYTPKDSYLETYLEGYRFKRLEGEQL